MASLGPLGEVGEGVGHNANKWPKNHPDEKERTKSIGLRGGLHGTVVRPLLSSTTSKMVCVEHSPKLCGKGWFLPLRTSGSSLILWLSSFFPSCLGILSNMNTSVTPSWHHCGRSSNNQTMGQGEKYACAELMVDEIKSAGGIMPKVSQTLAMKPDVVKDRRERCGWWFGSITK